MTVTDKATVHDTAQVPGSAYADESAAIRDAADDIGTYLALWAMRDSSKADAGARRAANSAMDAIDRSLRELHALRSRLVSDIRVCDDASAARVDAMLAAAKRPNQRAAGPAQRMTRKTGGAVTARLHVLDGKRAARLVRVSADELARLRSSARNAGSAYHAGFLDGRDRLDELGVTVPPRVRTPKEQFAVRCAALEENVIRAVWDAAVEGVLRAARPSSARSAPRQSQLRAVGTHRTKETDQ